MDCLFVAGWSLCPHSRHAAARSSGGSACMVVDVAGPRPGAGTPGPGSSRTHQRGSSCGGPRACNADRIRYAVRTAASFHCCRGRLHRTVTGGRHIGLATRPARQGNSRVSGSGAGGSVTRFRGAAARRIRRRRHCGWLCNGVCSSSGDRCIGHPEFRGASAAGTGYRPRSGSFHYTNDSGSIRKAAGQRSGAAAQTLSPCPTRGAST